jgi:quercetin dioxygenase-like cupin family protein
MNVVRFKDAERYEPEVDWKRVSVCSEADISIEHFTKPPYHASPVHEHANAQVLVVLKGRITLKVNGEQEHILEEGDSAYIPGGESHIVRNALDTPSMGLDIFVPGRSFDFWRKRRQELLEETEQTKEGRKVTPLGPPLS